MLTYPSSNIDTRSATGFSDEALSIDIEVHKIDNRFQQSCSIGLIGKGVFNQLDSIYNECSVPDWDGYDALPVEYITRLYTIRFLESLPHEIAPPEIDAEPDGHITMEWYKSPRWTLSVSIAPDGFLHYAALMGTRKVYGSERISSTISNRVLKLITEIRPRQACA